MSENDHNLDEMEKGMAIYEHIVNNVDTCHDRLDTLIHNLKQHDSSGQFLSSTARFLAAVDKDKFADYIPRLIEMAMEKDRERRYVSELLQAIWGPDYKERVDELRAEDDVFRRLYKRIYPSNINI